MKQLMTLTIVTAIAAYGGGLRLEVQPGSATAEGKQVQAKLTAQVVACHEPAKSVVTASVLKLEGTLLRDAALKVVALPTAGTFAVLGDLPANGVAVIKLKLTNPQFPGYEPNYLIRVEAGAAQMSGISQFDRTPTTADVEATLALLKP